MAPPNTSTSMAALAARIAASMTANGSFWISAVNGAASDA